MNKYLEKAIRTRPYIRKAIQNGLNDSDALHVKSYYPSWDELVALGSVEAEAGYRFRHNGDLYKCINANPTFQADWVPGVGTESLYTRIDETHAGTLEDPIPYAGNMELTKGLYYIQDGQTYICTRDTGIAVHHALSELIGHYVELVS